MLANFSDSLRIFLHVLGASVWVGGQIVLALLVPVLRKRDADLPRAVARAFNKIGWPAYALLVITGMWNMANPPERVTSAYQMAVGIKMMLVVISGLSAYIHTRAKNPAAMAMWGAISGLSALATMYVGVTLAG
ncbi:unannotated protein [freshwater metagenome]|jgi:hypothetical protein|uniref:Unannotated protein n=1 Tax=freshwater metagenome TaxID=449393 RepID=A0A6J7VHM3_9ZZZZ|nr:hypothetical protein [Actinomycetota bacterium]MSY51474.1 hypothetical protein [Actinomycetota bacterium]MSY87703.1 hypothetical protein [Actinomycetota bacterium]MTA51438.1 hypothetical protein [Actinomycetota bacterium]